MDPLQSAVMLAGCCTVAGCGCAIFDPETINAYCYPTQTQLSSTYHNSIYDSNSITNRRRSLIAIAVDKVFRFLGCLDLSQHNLTYNQVQLEDQHGRGINGRRRPSRRPRQQHNILPRCTNQAPQFGLLTSKQHLKDTLSILSTQSSIEPSRSYDLPQSFSSLSIQQMKQTPEIEPQELLSSVSSNISSCGSCQSISSASSAERSPTQNIQKLSLWPPSDRPVVSSTETAVQYARSQTSLISNTYRFPSPILSKCGNNNSVWDYQPVTQEDLVKNLWHCDSASSSNICRQWTSPAKVSQHDQPEPPSAFYLRKAYEQRKREIDSDSSSLAQ